MIPLPRRIRSAPDTAARVAPLLIALLVTPGPSHAQSAAPPDAAAVLAPAPVPTTRILAVGSFTATANATPAAWQKVLPDEVRATVRLYLDGKIDQWFVKQDQTGVVFLMNVTDPGEARALLEGLPFGPAGLMTFHLTPLGPIGPLRTLLVDPAQSVGPRRPD